MAHEVEMIVTHGLRPLSANLLTERIEAGHGKGLISATEAKAFHRAHVFATGEEGGREGQVCLILSKRQFEYNLEGCLPLLSTWGGEGIYRSSVAFRIKEKLGRLGSPAVVVARLQLGGDGPRPLMFPSLHKVFVGALLGLADTGADVFYRAPVPPENIEFVLQPSTDAYSRLGDLPLF